MTCLAIVALSIFGLQACESDLTAGPEDEALVEEMLEVYADYDHFSASGAALGPLVKVPEPDPGESWAEVIDRRRAEIPGWHPVQRLSVGLGEVTRRALRANG